MARVLLATLTALLLSAAAAPPPLDFDSLWDYADPAATEAAFRELLPEAERRRDADTLLQLQTPIARALGLQGRFDQAHALLDEVEGALTDELVTARVRYLLERGRAWNSGGQTERARPLFVEAWELAGAAGLDFHAVDAAHMVAIVEAGPAALQWNEKAVELAEASDDPRARGWLGSLHNNIGWVHHEAGRYDDALAVFERALAARLEQGETRRIRIAKWAIARTLRSLGRAEEALEMQRALQAEWSAEGGVDPYVDEEIAACLRALGRTEPTPADEPPTPAP